MAWLKLGFQLQNTNMKRPTKCLGLLTMSESVYSVFAALDPYYLSRGQHIVCFYRLI